MPIELSGNKSEIFFECGDLGSPDLIVVAFRGHEGISELFSYEIELASQDGELDFSTFVGMPGTLSWNAGDADRFVNGIVASFEQYGRGTQYHYYRVRLVPKAWFLTLRHNCKIFQGDDVKKIVTKTLQAAGLAENTDFAFAKYAAEHPAREYCVQYRETDWDFITRLCEDEGISYFFTHENGAHKLVFGDQAAMFETIEGEAEIPYRQQSGMVEGEFAVYRLGYTETVKSGKFLLRDYLFTNPDLDLTSDPAEAATRTELEVYDYPGGYIAKDWGSSLAGLHALAHRASRLVARGESDVRTFIPGHKFTLSEHERENRNAEYLLTRVEHWGDQRQVLEEDAVGAGAASPYGNRFECIPTSVDYRPEPLTPRPRVEGSQTARVCGPAGEEIWVDKYGRIKVQFHWDRYGAKDDKSTCWLRVSQAWAGAGWGITFWPRIGMEVIVDFLEGDPDQPIVTGCVYNGLNPVPYTLPDEKTKSTIKSNSTPGGGGSNEIRFEDAKGTEQVYIHAQKDMDTKVENNRSVVVGVDETHNVGHDRTIEVVHDETHTVKNDREVTVLGNHTESVTMDQTIKVTQSQSTTVTGSRSADVTGTDTTNVIGARSVSVGGAQDITVVGVENHKVEGSRTLQVGGTFTIKVGGDREAQISGNDKVQVSADASLEVGGAWSHKVEGDSSWETTGDLAVKANKIAMEAKEEIAIKCGSAEITIKSDGTINVKGKDISLEGSGNVTVKGQTVKIN